MDEFAIKGGQSMQVNWQVVGIGLCRQMGIHEFNQNRNILRLSTGLRINSAADDPAGLAISEKMRAQIRGLNMASRNAQDAVSMVQTADGALSEVHSMLQRMNELATESANGSMTDKDREALNKEYKQLLDQIDTTGDQTEFNDKHVFKDDSNGGNNNSSHKVQIQVGANEGQTIDINMEPMNSAVLGLKNTNISTQEDAQKVLTKVKDAINHVSLQRADYGAAQNRLEHIIDYTDNYAENLTDAESRIRDADMAKETMEFAKNKILMQATQSLFVQVRKQQESIIDLIKSMM